MIRNELLEILTRALFISVNFNLLREAKNGNLSTFPSLTEKNTTKFLEESEATALGHTYQAHKNTKFTQEQRHIHTAEKKKEKCCQEKTKKN